MKKYRSEIALFLFGIGIFYLIPAVVTLCGGSAESVPYLILAVALPEAAAVITYVSRRHRYLFPALCMTLLPIGYGVFFYPWHAEVWYSYYPDMGMCLHMGVYLDLLGNTPVVLLSLFIGALLYGIGDWEKQHKNRRETK